MQQPALAEPLLHCTIRDRLSRVLDATPNLPGPLAQDLLALTARIRASADEDPFGNPVLLVALAISRRMRSGALDEASVRTLIDELRDAAFADRARRLARVCRRHRHRGQPRGAGRPGPAAGAARPEGQPGALGGIPRPGRARPLRRGVHRPSHLRPARRGGARAGRDRQRPPDQRRRLSPSAAGHACRTSSSRPAPRSPTPVTRWTSSTPRC